MDQLGLGPQARSMAVWAVVQIPLVIHLLWIMALLSGLYLLSRQRLMVRVGIADTSKVFDLVTSSGVELLRQLDELLLMHANPLSVARTVGWSLGSGGPDRSPSVDPSAVLCAAAEHASRSLPVDATVEEVGSASFAFALSEFDKHSIDKQHSFGADVHPAPGGTGLCIGTAMFIASLRVLRL